MCQRFWVRIMTNVFMMLSYSTQVFMFTSHFYTFISQKPLVPQKYIAMFKHKTLIKRTVHFQSLSDATYAYNFSPYLLPCLFYFIFLFHFVPMKCDVSADTSFLRGQTKEVNPDAFFWTRTRLFAFHVLFSIWQTVNQ